MQSVANGQVWSCLDAHQIRVDWKVERVDSGGIEPRAHGFILSNGKAISFTIRSLSKGLRAARLVEHADGTAVNRPVERYVSPKTLEQTKTASDYRRTTAPKGAETASPRMEQAYVMRYEHGMSVKDIAAHFGVATSSVSNWCQRVKTKRLDEKRRAELGRTGS